VCLLDATCVCQDGLLLKFPSLYMELQCQDNNGRPYSFQVPPLVLADSAFGLETWQMTPYKADNTTHDGPQRRFNWVHSSARVVVEHAFGRLKGRFRLLLHSHRTSWNMGTRSILAAMVLHNYLGLKQDSFRPEWADGVEELGHAVPGTEEQVPGSDGEELGCALDIKQKLTTYFMQQVRPQRRPRNR